jgi:GT2 family glycosyltransferase
LKKNYHPAGEKNKKIMNNNYLIILLNYNNWQDTVECIKSLEASEVKGSNILVIENCSSDDSLEKLRSETPDVRLIQADKNLGFTGGNNLGIKYAYDNKFDYAIVLNNDTIIESKDTMPTLIDEMEKHPDFTLGAGRIFYYPDKDIIWYDGGGINRLKGSAFHSYLRKNKHTVSLSDETKEIEFISGCYMCIRMRDLPKLGYMDERLFIYLDDLEYSMRAINNNLKLIYVPKAEIYHKERGGGKNSPRLIYYTIRNRKIVINTHFGILTKIYFELVLIIKRIMWLAMDRKKYRILGYALKDYKNAYFGQAPDYIK